VACSLSHQDGRPSSAADYPGLAGTDPVVASDGVADPARFGLDERLVSGHRFVVARRWMVMGVKAVMIRLPQRGHGRRSQQETRWSSAVLGAGGEMLRPSDRRPLPAECDLSRSESNQILIGVTCILPSHELNVAEGTEPTLATVYPVAPGRVMRKAAGCSCRGIGHGWLLEVRFVPARSKYAYAELP